MNVEQTNPYLSRVIMPMIRRVIPELIHIELLTWQDDIPNAWLDNKKFHEFIKDKTTVRKNNDRYYIYDNHILSKTVSYAEYMILKGLDPNIVNLDEINIEDFN